LDWEVLAYGWSRHFGERAKTLTIRTPNMGYRMLYTTSEKENSSPFKRNLHMEFENGGYVAALKFNKICLEVKKLAKAIEPALLKSSES